ncbi:MAG: hypothetical protein QM811_26275 [Pirellulales bacterium]
MIPRFVRFACCVLGLVSSVSYARAEAPVVRSADDKKLLVVDADGKRIRNAADDKVVVAIDVHSTVNDNFSVLGTDGKPALYYQDGIVYLAADKRLRGHVRRR